jgi:hypothetical protein
MRCSRRSRSIRAETYTTPQPATAVSEAISSVQRLWFGGGITDTAESWRGVLCSIYVENGDFSGTLDVSTFLFSFLAFFTAFFSWRMIHLL